MICALTGAQDGLVVTGTTFLLLLCVAYLFQCVLGENVTNTSKPFFLFMSNLHEIYFNKNWLILFLKRHEVNSGVRRCAERHNNCMGMTETGGALNLVPAWSTEAVLCSCSCAADWSLLLHRPYQWSFCPVKWLLTLSDSMLPLYSTYFYCPPLLSWKEIHSLYFHITWKKLL